jgi:hypothetical protein
LIQILYPKAQQTPFSGATPMPRALLLVLSLLSRSAVADEIPALPGPKAPADVRAIAVSPAPEAVPAFKHRLYPLSSTRKSGNSVPIYLRFAHERDPETKQKQLTTSAKLLDAPSETFDLKASRELVNGFGRMFRQIDHAARKQTTDWSYTTEEDREDIFGMLLSDAQECRGYHRLVCLKARVESAEGKFDEAARTIETAFAMADQLAQGPFLINSLVGLATAINATDRVEDFISSPGAPSLYWSLLTLPTPTVSARRGIDNEFSLVDSAFPELSGLDQAEGRQEFEVRLNRVKIRFKEASNLIAGTNREDRKPDEFKFDEPLFPKAKAYLLVRKLSTPEQIEARPEAKTTLIAIKAQFEELRDERFKALLLPAREARQYEAKPIKKQEAQEIMPFTATLIPLLYGTSQAETRLERRVAVLRLIEALRIHASVNGGKFPKTLDEATTVPLPFDPSTGRPFGYRLDAEKAVIESPRTGHLVPELKYTISLRP